MERSTSPTTNELDHQVNAPVMQSQEQVVVFDTPEEEGDGVNMDSGEEEATIEDEEIEASTPQTTTAQRLLSERFQSWKQQASEQASSSTFLNRVRQSYNTPSRASPWKVGAAHLQSTAATDAEPTPANEISSNEDDIEEGQNGESSSGDDDSECTSSNSENESRSQQDAQSLLRKEQLRVWSQTISESVSQKVSTFRGRYAESVGKDGDEQCGADTEVADTDIDDEDCSNTRYTVSLGRGMLGVNLKATFVVNNGVYVDFVVERGTGDREGIQVGDHVVAVGDLTESIQRGTVVSVPTAIAQAVRPVQITMAYYELVPPSLEDEETASNETPVPMLNHIDVAVGLLNCDDPELMADLKVPNVLEQSDSCFRALLIPYHVEFPQQQLLLDAAQRRCRPCEPFPLSLTSALSNAALLTLADPRRTVFLTEHVAETELQHNLVLLAVELSLALELEQDWKDSMGQAVREIAFKYFLPTPVVKAAGASFDSNESATSNQGSETTTTHLQAPLLDVHSQFTQSDLQLLEQRLDSDVATAFGTSSLYKAVLERIDMRSFLSSAAAARMRGFLRGTVPYRNITATECWQNTDYLQYCLAYWMQTGQADHMCRALRRWRKRRELTDKEEDRVLFEYARNGHAEFRMSLYYEHLLNPEHQIGDLWRHAEFPPHWSAHKQTVSVEDEDDQQLQSGAKEASVYNAEMACAFAVGHEKTMIGCSFEPCNLDDLPAAGLLERYVAHNSGQQTAIVNFWLPRESVFGVGLVVSCCADPVAESESGEHQANDAPADVTSVGLALVSTQNVIVAMRDTLMRLVDKVGGTGVFDQLHRMLSNPTGDEEMQLKSMLDPFWSTAASPWIERPIGSQREVFVQGAGDQLLTSLTPIPLALLVLLALLEQKIVFTSSRKSLLLSTTTALIDLLRPLSWCHLMVPIVPDSQMASDLLDYPAPFLLGWHTPPNSDFLGLVRDLPESVTLVDLDVGRVICGISGDSSLRSPLLALAQQLGTSWAEKSYPNTWLCDHPVAPQELANRPFSALSASCHAFIEEMLSHTPECCYEVNGTVYLDEGKFANMTSVDDEIVQAFLRCQSINEYISSLEREGMAFSLASF